jgi:hypothetical protein
MTQRDQAIRILQEARDLLAQRLAERIVDAREQILEDAGGGVFVSEIDAVYEQLGSRLAHVNSMLAHLPAVEDPQSAQPSMGEPLFTEVAAEMSSAYTAQFHGAAAPLIGPLALPSPEPLEERGLIALPPPAASGLQWLAHEAERGDVAGTAAALAAWLGWDASLAARGAQELVGRWHSRPEMLARLAQLQAEAAAGITSAALALVGDCFGWEGADALAALGAMQWRLHDK